MEFYSYLWLREDGTPYYVGKGKGRRAFQTQHRRIHPPKDQTRILVIPCGTEAEAFALEISMIDLYGRKDLGTGCLRNLTDGGEGRAGAVASEETRRKQSAAKKGKPSLRRGMKASEETRQKQSAAAKARDPKTWRSGKKRKHLTAEQKQKKSAAMKLFWATHERSPISDETRRKMREAKLGKQFHLGFKNSEESKQKMRAAKQEYTPWNKGLRGKPWTPARRKAQEGRQDRRENNHECERRAEREPNHHDSSDGGSTSNSY